MMELQDPKDAAVDDLLNLQQHNPHSKRLEAAFAQKVPGRLPDFESIRRSILARRDSAEADRRRFRRVWIPATAAAAVLLSASVLFLIPRENSVAAQIVQIASGENQPLNAVNALGLRVRSAVAMTRTQSGTSATFKAEAMSALFEFEPNDRLRAVRIELPRATFSVIGTRFIVQAQKDFCFLAVETGSVRVEGAGKAYVVRGGEFWVEQKSVTRTGKAGLAGPRLFSAFVATGGDPKAVIDAMITKEKIPGALRTERRISVILKSGTVVNGVLLSERGGVIELRAPAADNQVLRFKKEEIGELRYLK